MTRFGIVLGAAAVLAWAAPALAATLDQEACAKLKAELSQLELTGARGTLAKGPEWAKANLAADKLQQIKRLLELDEQILFRCQGKPLVVLPEGVDAEAEPPDNAKDAATKPAAAKDASKQAKPPAKAQPKAAPSNKAAAAPAKAAVDKAGAVKAGAAKATTGEAALPPKSKPKPAAKAKVDDAYRPPPATAGSDPFASKP
jgi:hypothetical protein